MPAPAPAVDQQVVWKNDEIGAFAVSLVRHAVEAWDRGQYKFTTDIVPDAERGDGDGIAGSVVTQLKNAGVIQAEGVFQNQVFYAERIKSERTTTKGRWVGVYKLTSRAIAAEFLERHRQPAREIQPELLPV